MTTPTGLEAFTLYLDPEDPEDASIIRFLKPKTAKKRASAEIRRAILVYLELLKNGNARPVSSSLLAMPSQFQPPEPAQTVLQQLPPPSVREQNSSATGGSKSIQEARRAFMRR